MTRASLAILMLLGACGFALADESYDERTLVSPMENTCFCVNDPRHIVSCTDPHPCDPPQKPSSYLLCGHHFCDGHR
jgi:hypothetical protein